MDGLAETQHVFIAGNNIPERFRELTTATPDHVFTVGELGFGTGLNILALWQAWHQRGHNRGHLHAFSIEGFPLDHTAFSLAQSRIHARWPALAPPGALLEQQYPPLTPGVHSVRLGENFTLTLALGQAEHCLENAYLKADAWFLDGFSPAQNPDMWSEKVMAHIARLSKPDATVATFTVAGAVRRHLIAAGFSVEKTPGFGRKREMLKGTFMKSSTNTPKENSPERPWLSYENLSRKSGRRVLIVGAGIAGAAAAWHLKRAGFDVTVVDETGPASGASGNPAGLVLPRLDLGETPAARFYRDAWLYTVRLMASLDHDNSILLAEGGIIASTGDEDDLRHKKLIKDDLLPKEMLGSLHTDDLRDLTGIKTLSFGGKYHLHLTKGGTINPTAFTKALFDEIPVLAGKAVHYKTSPDTTELLVDLLEADSIRTLRTDYMVIATAAASSNDLDRPHITKSLGQIDVFDAAPPMLATSFGHYVAPLGNRTVTGATYENVTPETDITPMQQRMNQNLEALTEVFDSTISAEKHCESRTAIRAVTPDRHPIVGALPDWRYAAQSYDGLKQGKRQAYPTMKYHSGVFILSGLGSRGLTTAPYCGAMIASLISSSPSPAPTDQMELLHPARFLIRDLKRGK